MGLHAPPPPPLTPALPSPSLPCRAAPFFDEEDAALAAMEFARPRKISKSMSTSQLAGLDGADATGSGRPPLPPAAGGADKIGPLGKPIRRTNTFRWGAAAQAVPTGRARAGRALALARRGSCPLPRPALAALQLQPGSVGGGQPRGAPGGWAGHEHRALLWRWAWHQRREGPPFLSPFCTGNLASRVPPPTVRPGQAAAPSA